MNHFQHAMALWLELAAQANAHQQGLLIAFVVAAAGIILSALWIGRIRPSARRRRRQARKVMARLPTIKTPGEQFSYLRKINPFAFEELLLTSFQQRGLKIIRNRRYTGDGGIDGQVIIEGRPVLIQAKRYSSAINPAHVRDFAQLCQQRNRRGIFIHTGRTGRMSHAALFQNIALISGDRLLLLLSAKDLDLFGKILPGTRK